MDKQMMGHRQTDTQKHCSAVKRNEVPIHVTMSADEPYKYAKRKKTDTKGHTLFDSIYVKYPEELNLQRQKTTGGGWVERTTGRNCFMGAGFILGVMAVFWN